MLLSPEHPDLVVIIGPTAVGKTAIAVELAEKVGGEIISADSRTFYRGMDIGTAKPTPLEQARVRHHLVDIAEPDEVWSLVRFQEAVENAITEITLRGRLPFLVGGTGQYVRAILEGWQGPPVAPDPRLRQVLEDWAGEIGKAALHIRLAVLDPTAAARIDFHNLRRTIRALEVIYTTGYRFSDQRLQRPQPYRTLVCGLERPRAELFARIDTRIEAMLAAGWVEEVRALLDQGYSPDLPSFSAIGYREIVAFLRGKLTLEQAVAQIKRTSRVFVRRQSNWFKQDDPAIHWFTVAPQVVEQIEPVIRSFLSAGVQ